MTGDIVTRLRSEHKTEHNGLTITFTPTKDELDAAIEIERLRAELIDAVTSCYQMVRQYCEVHGQNQLWSHSLGAPADAMRICDRYGLLDNFSDNARRDVWADTTDGRDIESIIAKAVRGE
jgi:hypothetical protein